LRYRIAVVVLSVFGVYGLALVVFSFVSIVMILRRKESSEFIDKIGKQSKIFTMVELTGSPLENTTKAPVDGLHC
jgi:hypothetical protein